MIIHSHFININVGEIILGKSLEWPNLRDVMAATATRTFMLHIN